MFIQSRCEGNVNRILLLVLALTIDTLRVTHLYAEKGVKDQKCLIIHFIRHASVEKLPGAIYGYLGPQLSEIGIEQVKNLACILRGRNIQHLYTSPQRRAVMTAQLLADLVGGVTVRIEDRIRERNWGSTEGVNDLQNFLSNHPEHTIEPLELHIKRLQLFFRELIDLGESEVFIVGHSCFCDSLFEYFESLQCIKKESLSNCGMANFMYDDRNKTMEIIGVRNI